MRVAVIGAGPAGSETAFRLARAGVETVVYDPAPDREKPCGGGVPWRGLREFEGLLAADLPAREIRHVLFEAPSGATASVTLPSPLRVFSRRTLDARWAARAAGAGARVRAEKVVDVARDRGMRVRTATGAEDRFDLVVAADGATSRTRRLLSTPLAAEDLSQAVGYYVPGRTDDVARLAFSPTLRGYLWSFPRVDHLAIGACAPLAGGAAASLWREVDAYVARLDPSLDRSRLPRYSALIPALSPESLRANRIAGPGWLLVGDAAGSVDPLTREGIVPGLRSAALAADAVLAGCPERYALDWKRQLLDEMLWASERSGRFFEPALTERLVRYLGRSRAIRAVMADLVLGHQPYRTLKRRLLRAAVPFLLESGRAALRTARPPSTPRAPASTPSRPR
jgi:geranylgeranyl reductase family protein